MFVSISNSIEGHSIVETCFDMTSPMRSGTVKVGHTNRDWFSPTLEISTYWCSEDTELVFIRRFNTDNRVGPHHVRTNIERSTSSIRRNKVLVGLNSFNNSFYKALFIEWRHHKALCRIMEALSIKVWAENNNTTILSIISLHAFKYSLCVLENTSTFV